MALILPTTAAVAGHELTAGELQQIMTGVQQSYGVRAVQSGDQTNATTTLQNATGLSCALEASSYYRFHGVIVYQAAVAADINLTVSGPASATGRVSANGQDAAASAAFIAPYGGASNNVVSGFFLFGGTATDELVDIRGWITTVTAGNFQIQFAEATANATGTILRGGSWLTMWKD
jgi:hypothetical protein